MTLYNRLKIYTLAALLTLGGSLLAGTKAKAQTPPPTAALFDLVDFGTPTDTQNQFSVGANPAGLVAGPNGTFYGVTQNGGASGDGTVFRVEPYGTGMTALYAFGSGDGPASSVTPSADGSLLFGTFQYGGDNINGALWKLSADGTGYQRIYAFSATDLSTGANPDGVAPTGSLLEGPDGALYGEAQFGGPNAGGTVFKVDLDGTNFMVLHAFGADATDGAYPIGGLTAGPDGTLYGVCGLGGTAGTGTVFQVKTDGTSYLSLHEFAADDAQQANTGGAAPSAALTFGTDKLLYGVTAVGGSGGSGVVFCLGTDGTQFAALHDFSGTETAQPGGDGGSPISALALDKTGALYGTTTVGGNAAHGTVYRIGTDGVYESLYALRPGDGVGASLVSGSNGLVYGTTADGGGSAEGELFRVDTNPAATHVLLTKADGQMALWSVGAADDKVAQRVCGPYAGWTALAVADGPDGLTRVLWTQASGQISVWHLDSLLGTFTHAEYGPYPGWTAVSVSVGPDNTDHILWTHTNGAMSLWSLSAADGSFTHHEYGPHAGWTANAVTDGPDGVSHVLWTQASGLISLWNLDSASGAFTHAEFGPYSGWSAHTLSVGADNILHTQWSHSSGQLSVWNSTPADPGYSHFEYGPYGGWTALATADSPDGLSRILWTQPSGLLSVWDLDNALGAFSHFEYAPSAGWTPKALSVGL